jgi:myo-inositol 2-dehydrogenase/D-chiro-inositol 1-dehydrogenase/scyllo-inositol 2-dehydrogenase (NAD+)
MKDGRVGVCVIGVGRAGMIHASNFARLIPQAVLVSVVDPVKEVALSARSELGITQYYTDFKESLKNEAIDAVVVVTPTKFHREVVIASAEAGKHILCEKPMAMTVEECDEMIAATTRHSVKLQIGFMRRFDKNFMTAKERIDAGEIGEVVQVRSITYGPSTPKPWMYDISKSNGPLAEVNSHDIDTLRWYTGSEFKEVYAIGGNYRCPKAKLEFPDFYDNVLMSAQFVNGMQGSIGGAQGVQYGYDSRCEILGTKGIIFVGSLEERAVMSCTVGGMMKPIVHSWISLFEEAYLAEDKHFIECILENKQPKVSGLDGRAAVEVVNAGNKSITHRQPVKISEI